MMRPMARYLGFFLMVGLAVLARVGVAAAQESPEDERARLHFQSGASYYEAGDYEDALREFTRSFELSEKPALFYNFSLCHQQMGHYEVAADYLQRYLEQAEPIPNRANLERRLENLRQRADEELHRTTREPEPEAPAPTFWEGLSPLVYVGSGVAVAGLISLAVAGPLALVEKQRLDDDPCSTSRICDAGSLRVRALVADVGLGLFVVGAALATTFFFLGGDDDEASARLELVPSAGPEGAGAWLRGTF